MKLKTMLSKVAVFTLAAICCISLAGCGSKYGYTGGTAATVNGVAIDEDTITKYIEDFRASRNLTSDEEWAAWLKESDLTPESYRQTILDSYIQRELVRQAAEENEIVIEQSAIDEYVDAMKKNYSNDKAWQDALTQMGVTEEQYRESIELGLTSRELQQKVVAEVDTSDDAGLLEFMNEYKDMINGSKRSSHILFEANDAEKAEEVANQLQAGQLDFATAAQQYSIDTGSAQNGGDVGWNTINNFVDAYNNALDSIEKDQITMTVSDYGVHIILCTEVFNVEDDPTSLEIYPSEIVEYMRSIYGSKKQSEDFQEWLKKYQEEADIVINEMPANVPYNIDLSQFDSEGSNEEGTENSPESESSSDGEQSLGTTDDNE